ncbi:MAG: hypothetical protein LBD06_13510, partial [Candidatus Accumulibacter sp.]|nr:hypothetical protein [Accumulibacter sp.]
RKETITYAYIPANSITIIPYLCSVLACIAEHPDNRVNELLPWNIGALHALRWPHDPLSLKPTVYNMMMAGVFRQGISNQSPIDGYA